MISCAELYPSQSFLAKFASQRTPVTALRSRLMMSTIIDGRNNLLHSCTVIKSSLKTELTSKIDFCNFQLKEALNMTPMTAQT